MVRPLGDLLAVDDRYRWVERQAVQRAIDEVGLSQQLGQEADPLQIGRWSRADLVVHAWVDPEPTGSGWEIKVIDTLTAEAVARRTWRPARPARPAGNTKPDKPDDGLGIGTDLDGLTQAIQDTLDEGVAAARAARGSTRIAGLFIQNVSPSGRLSELEPAIFSGLAERTSAIPDLHLIRFDHVDEAGGEQALAMMGLSDNRDNAWMGVADYYLWGSVRQPTVDDPIDGPVDTDGWELTLQIWDGGDQTADVNLRGSFPNLADQIGPAVDQLIDQLPRRPSPRIDAGFPATLASRLIKQSRDLRADLLKRSPQDVNPTTEWGWRIQRGQRKLNELACFFDPTDPAPWSALLATKRQAMLGDTDHEYPRILSYLDTRYTALRVAGPDAVAREDPATIEDLLRKLSGGWGMRGVPEGLTQDDFRSRVQPLIADILNGAATSGRSQPEVLRAILGARTTDTQRIEAVQLLWPAIRPNWERQQRRAAGHKLADSAPAAIYDKLEARITKLLIKNRQEALLDAYFTLSELPENKAKPRKAAVPAPAASLAPAIKPYALRWTADPTAVLEDVGDLRGVRNAVTPAGRFLPTAVPYLKAFGLEAIDLNQVTPAVRTSRPNDSSLRTQRVPVLAGGAGFTALIDTGGTPKRGKAAQSITRGAAAGGDRRRPLAEVFLPGFENYPFSLGEAFSDATQPTDLAVAGPSIWVTTTTEGAFAFDTLSGQSEHHLFDQGLLDRTLTRVLANDRYVVLGYADQPTFAVRRAGADAFENPALDLPPGVSACRLLALSGDQLLITDDQSRFYGVIDLKTNRLSTLNDALASFLGPSPARERSRLSSRDRRRLAERRGGSPPRSPKVLRGVATDANRFYLLFATHLVRLEPGTLTVTSWEIPALDWSGMHLDEQTLWLTAKGPGLPGFSETQSVLVWGWDLATQRGARVAVSDGRVDAVTSVASDRFWVGLPRSARGYPLAALRRAVGLPSAADAAPSAAPAVSPTPPATPAGLTAHLPVGLALDLSDACAIGVAVEDGTFDPADRPGMERLLAYAIAHDRPELLMAAIKRFGLNQVAGRNRLDTIQRAAEAGASKVVALFLDRIAPESREFALQRVVYGYAVSGRDDRLATFLRRALPLPTGRPAMAHDPLLSDRFRGLTNTTPLEAAAHRGHLAVVKRLLPHVETQSTKDHALVLAVLGRHPAVASALVEAGADPYAAKYRNHAFSYSATALALVNGLDEAFQMFWTADLEAARTALSDIDFVRNLTANQQFATLRRLTQLGVDLDQRGERVVKGSDRTISLRAETCTIAVGPDVSTEAYWQNLIDAGYPFDHRQERARLGDLLLMQASARDPRLAVTLLDAGYGPDAPDVYGTTPLMLACLKNKPEMIRLLLSRGADPSRVNADGQSATALLPSDAPDELRQSLAAPNSPAPESERTVADGAAGPSPMQAARILRTHITDGNVYAAEALLDHALIDFDDGAGAGEAVLEFAIDHDRPDIAAMIAQRDWSLPDYWTGYHRFSDALERGYVEVAGIILNRAGWNPDRRRQILARALKQAEEREQVEVVRWLNTQSSR